MEKKKFEKKMGENYFIRKVIKQQIFIIIYITVRSIFFIMYYVLCKQCKYW